MAAIFKTSFRLEPLRLFLTNIPFPTMPISTPTILLLKTATNKRVRIGFNTACKILFLIFVQFSSITKAQKAQLKPAQASSGTNFYTSAKYSQPQQNSTHIFSRDKHLKFQYLQTNDGLSQSNVLRIMQDSRGFMWFGTRDGLNRYDGYKFTVYKNDPKNKNSISNNYVPDIIESADGNLWIATWGGGVNHFDRATGVFTCLEHNTKNPNSITSDFINAIGEDAEGNLWIGTESDGLDMYDKKSGKFTHYKFDSKNQSSLSDNSVRMIYKDKEQNLWIGTTHGGLNLFNQKNKNFTRFQHHDSDVSSLANNDVHSIFEDSKHRNVDSYKRKRP